MTDRHHAFLKRQLVTSGMWGRLGPAAAVLPVMALFSSGLDGHRATIRTAELQRLSGLHHLEFPKARQRLRRTGLAEFSATRTSRLWSFELKGVFGSKTDGFRFPGLVVSEGHWSRLGQTAQSLAVALAALTVTGDCPNHRLGLVDWTRLMFLTGLDLPQLRRAMDRLEYFSLVDWVDANAVPMCGNARRSFFDRDSLQPWYSLPREPWGWPESEYS